MKRGESCKNSLSQTKIFFDYKAKQYNQKAQQLYICYAFFVLLFFSDIDQLIIFARNSLLLDVKDAKRFYKWSEFLISEVSHVKVRISFQ